MTNLSIEANRVDPAQTAPIISLTLMIDFTLGNSADSDEMPHSVAFHQGHHCLQNYLFWSFKSTKG